MERIFRGVLLSLFIIIPMTWFLSGCSAPCNYPDQRGVVVRIVNAMPDMPMITVFINGKILVKNYNYDLPTTCLYLTKYDDGSLLNASDSQLIVVTADAAGKDTVAKAKIFLNFNRQTIVVMGRGHIKAPMKGTSKIIRLDDELEQANPLQTLVRFVDAIPDLDSLDVYFKTDISGSPKPDLTIHYGESTHHLLLQNDTGMVVTEAGHPNHIIFTFPYAFEQLHIFGSAIVRGESKPLGIDFTASPLLLSDADCGNYFILFKTFAVRLVNATRSTQLNLLIRSTYISPENSGPLRTNYPNQQLVFNIDPGKFSDYLPMNISLDSIAGYWFSKTTDPKDTVASSIDHALANIRYSKIAIEDDPVAPSSTPAYSYLNLPDTMTNPSGNFARVRVINLSPDHSSIIVSLGSRTDVSMVKKQVEFFDVPVGSPMITLKDGSATMSYTLPVSPVTPISVYLLPEQSGTPSLPIMTSSD